MMNAIKMAVKVYQVEKEIEAEHKKAYKSKNGEELRMHWARIDYLELKRTEYLIEKRCQELLAA